MSPARLEVLFTPADFSALTRTRLTGSVCVVFDVLRATSSMTVALANGAVRIHPAAEIAAAVKMRALHPGALLAGERDGRRILAAQSGGVDFDLGNSPREFTPALVQGREIIMTTTNGTRALAACAGAAQVVAGSILNLGAVARRLGRERPSTVLIVCAGTYEEAAYEDTWAAGALCDLIWNQFAADTVADSAQIARETFRSTLENPAAAPRFSRNARRLLADPDLRDDVPFCWRRDALETVGVVRDGAVEMAGK